MRRLEITDREIMEIALRNEILRSEEARYDHRLHGVLLVSQGMSCYEVGKKFGHDPTTIQQWVRGFETRWVQWLAGPRKARASSAVDSRRVGDRESGPSKIPREFGYVQNLWDGKLLSHHIGQTQKVVLKVRQCQRLFHQLEFRLRKPTPVIARANLEEQRAFKKTTEAGKERRH